MGKYFGTDGVRGVAFEKLNAELAYTIGQAIVEVLEIKEIVIGMDTRLSSPMLAYSLANGAMACGANILFAGVVSTPMIALYSKDHQNIGVMITASHNPFYDNGIKIFYKGYKMLEEVEAKLEAFMDQKEFKHAKPFGTLKMTEDVKSHYLKLYENLNIPVIDQKIVYDSAHGANYLIAHDVFSIYAKNAIQFNHQPNGLNINLDCGSTHMDFIKKKAKSRKSNIAFSFDGDGDRVLATDGKTLFDGDLLIYVIASYLKEKNLLNKNTVVLTKMSNPAIVKALKEEDIDVIRTDVGDKYVVNAMQTHNYILGGENSGHIIMSHILDSGDGLLVAMYLLKIMAEKNKSLHELTQHIKMYPQKTINIKNIDKKVLNNPDVAYFLENTKKMVEHDGLFLVRASGTEPLIRVTVSHPDKKYMEKTIKLILNFLTK